MNRGKTWYRSIRWLAGLAGLFLMAWSTVEGKDVAALEAEFVATIDRLPAMGAEKIVDRKDAQLEFEKVCFANSGPGKEVEQEALCRAIMQRVGPTVAKPARVWLLRKVEPIGRDEVVSGLVVLLGDPDGEIRDLARRALQNNPSPKAAAALAAELAKAKDNAWRVALINALAFRRDADSVVMLGQLTADQSDTVAAAAVSALGRIATVPAVKIIADLRAQVRPAITAEVIDASLRIAETLVNQGSREQAARIYEELFSASEPESVRIAALNGIVVAMRDKALPVLMAAVKGENERMRVVAIGHLRDLPGKQVTAELVAAMEQATPADAPVFIELLGRRGDKEALSAIVKMVDHAEPDVRQTALRELSSLADGSTVALLASRAANGPEKERDAARGALARSRGTDIDKAIVAAIPVAEPNVAVELIKATAARRCVVAIAALEKAAESADEKVRNAAFSSLGTLVGKDDLAGLVRLLVNAQGESTSHIAEEALSAACLRMNEGQGRAAPVIAAMANAQSAAKAPLLRVLGRIGGDDAMVAVAEQCKTAEEQVKNIAVNVLADWKSPAAVDALLDIAKSGEKAVYRRQALKGYVRLISGLGKDESNKIFAGLTNAMTLATEAEDKKMVLEAMKGLGDMQTLKYVLPFLAEPELRPGAETAVLGIAPKLAGTNFEQAIAAIEEVHRMASSNGVRQQAAQQLGTLRSVCVAWLFAGSYQQQGKSATQLFDIAFDPEIPGKSVEWRRLEATNSELFGKFDLGKEPDRVGYVKTSIWSDKEQDARLAIGSDDGIKVWLNGEVVFANNATRGFKVDEDIVKIKLREGWNPLMIKVTQGGGDWLICCKVQAPSGEVLPGLKFEAK